MYQSLYRTWRPRTFSDMVGQDAIVRTLRNQTISGHTAHAYLFCGSRGTGKTSAARIMAMAINCQSPDQGDPCLICESCKTILAEQSLDVFEMDAASNSRVEEIREMLEKVNYPPQFAKFKVYIIDEVHMLSNAAFNALLKTLEEPPDYMVFILATTEPQKLPATILSRCQRFDFGRISEEAIIGRLKMALQNDQQADEAALEMIAAAAEGSMRDAWSLMDICLQDGQYLTGERVQNALGAVNRAFMLDFLDALSIKDAAKAMQLIRQLMKEGKDVLVFLRDLARMIREVIAAGLGASPTRDTTEEDRQRMQSRASAFSLPQLTTLMDMCMRAEADARWASSQRTVLEVFALKACQPPEANDASGLQERVAILEREVDRLASPGAITQAEPAKASKPKPVPAAEDSPAKEETPAPVRTVVSASSPTPPSGTTLPKDVWNRMLGRVKKELTSCYGIIQQGQFGGFRDGAFRLSYDDEHAFFVTFMNDPARKSAVEKILTEEMGAPAVFEAIRQDTSLRERSKEQLALDDIEKLSALVGRENLIVQDK
ncbi:MAG: DNA polymerase III subunit gamma/tau [Eubacteriales bacterium]|nr:DNA polymerase III subunit gamma/tau [Eubacteriales bacterium]MDD4105714.1 DNA polymerase III subunit gamma/tau [Eubacteriales bacterium]MDD4710186.1 DNA polymerase III subunit gamma/tau [Eubacteriales bacterium]NLO14750.1 DNA polymerase III subunit gamma/tau [Clostridiales bacterium]